MAYFNIVTTQIIYETTTVEADTEAQALEIVYNDTGGLQWDYLDSAGWEITEVKEV